MSGLNDWIKCEVCGWVTDPTNPVSVEGHDPHHEETVRGTLIPTAALRAVETLGLQSGDFRIAVVSTDSPPPLIDLARYAGLVPSRMDEAKTQFDGGDYDRDERAHVFLALTATHVAGLLVTRERDGRVRSRWKPDLVVDGVVRVDEEWPQYRQPCESAIEGAEVWVDGKFMGIEYVWVHPSYRRRGISRRLVGHAAAHWEIPLLDLSWKIPFMSSAGATLAHGLTASEFWAYT